ncbi:MAG: tyrosine-protein phosphatase [Paracoccus aminovorans]|nr:tyrosine-protein phosphatase [Paracoccus aminovorans]
MRRWLAGIACAAALCLLAALGWAGWLQWGGNFHAVVPGLLYRSAQPAPADLARWSAAHGLRSVLNLRGASGAGWYRDEIAAAARLGLVHADFAMKDNERLDPVRAARLVALIDSLPKPVLIHCKAGADRTGLAAALYLAAHGAGESRSEAQLSFRFGHVGLPLAAAWAMDESWEGIEPALGYES